jgi:hypothetical protein
VWQDPKTAQHCVLFLDGIADGTTPVKRFPLNDSSKVTIVSTVEKGVGWGFFNLSADGKYAGIELEKWGNIGVIEMATSKYTSYHKSEFGCQCQIAPDNSYYMMGLKNYSGSHPNYTVWRHGGQEIKTFAPPAGDDCGHPRWVINLTKSRCLVMVSPDEVGDVYLVEHSDDMSTVVKKVKVSTTKDCSWPAGWSGSGTTSLQRVHSLFPSSHSRTVVGGANYTVMGRLCPQHGATAPSCIIRADSKPGAHISGIR